MKALKAVAALLFSAVILAGCADSSSSSSSAKSKDKDTSSKTKTEQIVESCIVTDKNFETYVSNTYVATGNNYIVKSVDNKAYRVYLPVEEAGELEYCFYFSNISAAFLSSSRISRCCGHTLSHIPHSMQALALPLSSDVTRS